MQVLLTGANGNLGSSLQRQGTDLHWLPLGRADWSKLDELGKNADVIVHAASDLLTSIGQDPMGYIDSNVQTTSRLLAWYAQSRSAARFMFISSCAVYGHSEITHEDTPLAPISVNGTTKLLNEQLILRFAEINPIPFQIFRPFNSFGGSDRFSILAQLQRAVKSGRPFKMLNNGVSQRDFIHVDDVAAILLHFLRNPGGPQILNVGSGEATRIRDIVNEFRKKNPNLEIVSGQRPETEYSRADIARLRAVLPAYQFRNVLDFTRQAL